MTQNKKRKIGKSGESLTVGITIRPPRTLLACYEEVAARANQVLRSRGERANVTAQQVMLQRLASLPLYKGRIIPKK